MVSPYIKAAAERAGLALPPCPECSGQSVIWMLGEEWPCPYCQAGAYDEQLRERRIDNGAHGAGA